MIKTILFFTLLLPVTCYAQFTITGKVLNQADKKPVADASIFLSNASVGSKTNSDGTFTLTNAKPGKYDLVISVIGFNAAHYAILVDGNMVLPVIEIAPKAIALKEVSITSKHDPNRERNYQWFKNEFLGTSELAKECKIINPEMLDLNYDEKTKILTATSFDFLIIENRALGYKIKYLLSDFMLTNTDENDKKFLYTGAVLFEAMKGTVQQQELWEKRRQEVYEGSRIHFLRAASGNRIDQEGFRVLRMPLNPARPADSIINLKIKMYTIKRDKQNRDSLAYWIKKSKLPKFLPKPISTPLTKNDIIQGPDKQGLFDLKCDNCALYITYNKEHHFGTGRLSQIYLYSPDNSANTLVIFDRPIAYFDHNGAITNSGSLTFNGAWAGKRLAELLPIDYESQQNPEMVIDSTLIKKLSSKLNIYATDHRVEKAYLHLDKPYYAAGDTIYFKAYVTAGPKHERSSMSGVLNADLVDPYNHFYKSIKLKLTDGVAWGDFALDDTLKAGNYRIRAYTNWMRNAGEDYFFDENIPVINTIPAASKTGNPDATIGNKAKKAIPKSKGPSLKYDIQFFPEGGSIVNGVLSKIAFKAIAPDGLGTAIEGIVTDSEGHKVCNLISQHLGMGVFAIKPEPGKTYEAKITYADSSTAIVELPKASDSGYALNIDNSDPGNIRVNITAGKSNPSASINLVGQSGGVIYYYKQLKIVNNSFSDIISKNEFPTGIVQFTVFSSKGEPMNERLVFVQNQDQLKLGLSTGQQIYSPRQKVKIDLNAKDNDNHNVAGFFSVAITDETKVPVEENVESNIISNLLLTSDIKGHIENPGYYFINTNDKTRADLDVLMLTQGYHRFEWQPILNDQFPAVTFRPERTATTISGNIKNQWGKPIPYGKVSILSVTKGFYLSADTMADKNGVFLFKHLPVKDSVRYVIEATDKKIRQSTLIRIDNTRPPVDKSRNETGSGVTTNNLSVYQLSSNIFRQEQLKQGLGNSAIRLKEVEIKNKRGPAKYLEHSTNLNGPGNADQVITADQLPQGCPVFTDCITSRLRGIQFIKGRAYMSRAYNMPMLIIIDGAELSGDDPPPQDPKKPAPPPDLNTGNDIINSIDINDVASIEVLANASSAGVYGVKGAGGVLIITTKRGDNIYNSNSPTHGIVSYSPAVYHKSRTFYSPRYDVPKADTHFADLRTTIYWNPNLITDKDGKTSFEFFNADGKGSYRVVVEGVDDKGNLGRQVYRYKVE
jgi:TonB-dependent SusC/RagA subfamily outer membrane receptor